MKSTDSTDIMGKTRDYIDIIVEHIVEISSYNPVINVVFIPDKVLQFFLKKVACLCHY